MPHAPAAWENKKVLISLSNKEGQKKEVLEIGKTLKDLPEVPTLLGGIIMDKTFDELDYFVGHGSFEKIEERSDEPVVARRGSRPF